ncbi:MAG: chemotaxis protein CheW [Leptothrix sp. (in: b-proteobacteria)]
MANKEALRELQGRLAQRLNAVRTDAQSMGWLAVESGGYAFLLPLAEAGEIFQPGVLVSVPHTQGWFLGVANLRGTLTGVVDLAAFLGLRERPVGSVREQGRLVVFSPTLELNSALLVDRLAGLRNQEQLQIDNEVQGPQPAYVGTRYRDSSGRLWQELRLAVLARDERFLRIVAGQ